MKDKEKIINASIHFLECIIENKGEITANGVAELFEIHNKNKKVILEHLKAISTIMNKAIKILESEED